MKSAKFLWNGTVQKLSTGHTGQFHEQRTPAGWLTGGGSWFYSYLKE